MVGWVGWVRGRERWKWVSAWRRDSWVVERVGWGLVRDCQVVEYGSTKGGGEVRVSERGWADGELVLRSSIRRGRRIVWFQIWARSSGGRWRKGWNVGGGELVELEGGFGVMAVVS